MQQLSSEDLQEIYKWVDTIPLSRVKKNIARDFSDGVLISEVVHHFFPKLIELHNYSTTNSVSQKAYNWRTINQKVFRKIGFQISEQDVNDIVTCKRGSAERVLKLCKVNFVKYQKRRQQIRMKRKSNNNNNNNDNNQNNHKQGNRNKNIHSSSPLKSNNNFNNHNYNDNNNSNNIQSSTTNQIIQEKERVINHLNDKMEILELKVQKLEQLLRLKDAKIETLQNRLS